MRQYIALFFIGLIAVSSVQSFNQDVHFLKSLKSNEFGNTLINSIQLELKSSTGQDAVNRVLSFLNTISTQIRADGRADKKKQVAYELATNKKLSALAKRIVNLNRKLANDANLIRLNNAAIVVARRRLAHHQKVLAVAQRALAKNLALQARTTRVYRRTFAQLSAQITGLAQARQILANFNGKSFEQTSQTEFVQLTSSLSNLQFQHPKFQGFVQVLSEMLSSSERVHHKGTMVKIIKLIDTLYGQIVKQVQALTAEYQRQTAVQVLQQKRIQHQINYNNGQITHWQHRIASLQSSNARAEQRIRNNQQRLTQALKQQKDLQNALRHSQQAYAARRAERKGQLQILAVVVRIFKTRFTDAVRASIHKL